MLIEAHFSTNLICTAGLAEATQHWGGSTIDVTPPPQSRSQKHYLGVNIGGAEAPLAPPVPPALHSNFF